MGISLPFDKEYKLKVAIGNFESDLISPTKVLTNCNVWNTKLIKRYTDRY